MAHVETGLFIQQHRVDNMDLKRPVNPYPWRKLPHTFRRFCVGVCVKTAAGNDHVFRAVKFRFFHVPQKADFREQSVRRAVFGGRVAAENIVVAVDREHGAW